MFVMSYISICLKLRRFLTSGILTRLIQTQRVRSYPFSAVVMAGFTLTEEQFAMLMGRWADRVPAGSKQRLNPRWMKLNDFNGNQSEWSDWAFGFKRAIRGADLEVFEIMEKVERANADFEEDELNQFTENGGVSKISGELYDLLCTVVKK